MVAAVVNATPTSGIILACSQELVGVAINPPCGLYVKLSTFVGVVRTYDIGPTILR